ncbi:MAG: regulatory protein RecX [Rikenellaceae bacterium]
MRREAVKTPRTKSPEQALSSLMRQCARAEKSSGDAMRLMSRWGVPAEHRAGVLQQLIAEKFIDDRRFAQAYVREKLNLSGWGVRKIASSLKVKGINEAIISEVLSDLDREGMEERLFAKIERKARSVKYKDKYDFKSKLIRYGISLGYDYSMVLDSVSKIISIDDE